MISIALRNLLAEKTRFLISAGGVAFSVMLILVILSLYQGWQIKSTQYVREIETDIWVTQNGASDLSSSASLIPESVGQRLEQIEGVEKVSRFVGRPLQFELKNEVINAYIVGVDHKDTATGPKHLLEGRSNPAKGEIIIDKVLAKNHKLVVGDLIEIFNKTFRIAGITEGANMFLFQFSFINMEEASELINLDSDSTYYLVNVKEGQEGSVIEKINGIVGVEGFTKEDFLIENKRLINEVFIPIITVLVLLSVLVGITVIGLTIYTVTLEKNHEFGVLKALGASNFQIYRILFEQAIISGVVGYLAGISLTYFVLWLIPIFVPVFVTVTLVQDLLFVALLSILMSLVASYVPIRRIIKIDPALVFKS